MVVSIQHGVFRLKFSTTKQSIESDSTVKGMDWVLQDNEQWSKVANFNWLTIAH